MENFIIKLGNAITGALGISNEAIGLVVTIGIIWFYIFKWRPFQTVLMAHIQNETDANGSYAERAAVRDEITKKLQESLEQIDLVLSRQSESISKVDSTLRLSEKERAKLVQDVDTIKMELIKISTQLSMSPNARSLS